VVSILRLKLYTCIAHHQLAIAVVFIVAGHMYRTNFGIGHNMKEILDAHRPPGGRLGAGHTGYLKRLLILYIRFSVSIFRCCDIANCTTYVCFNSIRIYVERFYD
jgi:hypothetical protein